MRDTPEDEARALLAIPKICEDAPDWAPDRQLPFTDVIHCGLLDENGASTGLFLSFRFTGHKKNIPDKYVMSVMKFVRGGDQERVYQLEVKQWAAMPPTEHHAPHEHIGDARTIGDATWLRWTYGDMLTRFCQTATVEFRPLEPRDPSQFALKP